MKTIDFSNVPDLDEYSPVPEDQYLAEIGKAEYDTTRAGDDYLKIRFYIVDGDHAGAAIFDRVYFSKKAMPRLKLLLEALGISTKESIEVTPALLEGRKCLINVVVESYVKSDGSEAKTNSIPYAGYHKADEEEAGVQPY